MLRLRVDRIAHCAVRLSRPYAHVRPEQPVRRLSSSGFNPSSSTPLRPHPAKTEAKGAAATVAEAAETAAAETGETVKAAEEAVQRISTNRRITWGRILAATSAVFVMDFAGMGFISHESTAHLWDIVPNALPLTLMIPANFGVLWLFARGSTFTSWMRKGAYYFLALPSMACGIQAAYNLTKDPYPFTEEETQKLIAHIDKLGVGVRLQQGSDVLINPPTLEVLIVHWYEIFKHFSADGQSITAESMLAADPAHVAMKDGLQISDLIKLMQQHSFVRLGLLRLAAAESEINQGFDWGGVPLGSSSADTLSVTFFEFCKLMFTLQTAVDKELPNAGEVVQEVLFKVMNINGTGIGEKEFSPWLALLAHSDAMDKEQGIVVTGTLGVAKKMINYKDLARVIIKKYDNDKDGKLSMSEFKEFYKREKFSKSMSSEAGDATAWTSFGYVFQELISTHTPAGFTAIFTPLVASSVMMNVLGSKPSAKIRYDK